MRVATGRGAVPPVVSDAILGACVAVGLLAAAVAEIGAGAVASARAVDVGAVALAATIAAAVAVRRRYPVAALVVLNVVYLLWFAGGYPGRLITLAPLIGCYTIAAHRGWRWGLAAAVPTALVGIVGIRVVLGDTETVGVVPIAVLLVATAGSAGAAVGYYRAVLAATRAQLVRETQSREERARRLAVEERLRIARELHDVFGHAMATISVQAGSVCTSSNSAPGRPARPWPRSRRSATTASPTSRPSSASCAPTPRRGRRSRGRPGAGSIGSPTCSTRPRPAAYGWSCTSRGARDHCPRRSIWRSTGSSRRR